jgi:CheY-like chemotaxis protein
MTPRQADVAYVLEAVRGVMGAYAAVDAPLLDFVIELEAGRYVPAAHYALLRVLSHEECARVHFLYPEKVFPPSLVGQLQRLVLGEAERRQACVRLPSPRKLPRARDTDPFTVLLVGLSGVQESAIRDMAGSDARLMAAEATMGSAFAARAHAIVVGEHVARLPLDFVGMIGRADPEGAAGILVLASETHPGDLATELRARGHGNWVYGLPAHSAQVAGWLESRRPAPPKRSAQVPDARVLVVGGDEVVAAVMGEVLATSVFEASVEKAAALATRERFDLVLCDGTLAFGADGLLAKLPLETARRVLVMAEPAAVPGACTRLQGTDRILVKPLQAWVVGDRVVRARAVEALPPFERARVVEPLRRVLAPPPAGDPFTVLLVGVEDEVHEALRRIFREDARHLIRPDPMEAAELALSRPLHAIVCGADAALHPRSFLRAVANEDPAGAERVVVVARARDVPYTKHKLEEMRRSCTVLALPIDDAMLEREVFRDHPELVARVAVRELGNAGASRVTRPRFRRLAVLVVDDDRTTQILFAAADAHAGADVTLVTTAMEAFEHVSSRDVDLLVASATLRAEGGEPLYRTLWRLRPALKARTVLVAPPEATPASAPRSQPPRLLERPLTRDALARVVTALAGR